uniref:Cystathionine gamma-synthase n=1 Tax=Globisporangium ultimum (strain ATCC 200006 / CBS 805.95 / DAOM BR144) TaxID=431595 RepID=K3X5K5_GLOUD
MVLMPLALGVSLPPNEPHALSVSMPLWEHVVGYEEGRRAVLDAMACGYPRFFYHPFVVALTQHVKANVAALAPFFSPDGDINEQEAKWDVMVSPTEATALRLQSFLVDSAKNQNIQVEASDVAVENVHGLVWAVRFPKRLSQTAKQFWQHSGEIVTSRHAERALQVLKEKQEATASFKVRGTDTHQAVQTRIASLYLGEETAAKHSDDVFLYPTGMGAIFATVRLLNKIRSGAKSILIGFPYVDTLKILSRTEWCEKGVYFFPVCGEKEMKEVEEIVEREQILGVFTEFPGNPLLSTSDLSRLAALAHENGTVLVVDDTVGSYNVNVMNHGAADIVTTSLSKIFSGTCAIMGGSVVFNPAGPMYQMLKDHISSEDAFSVEEDAQVLLETSVDVLSRLAKVNASSSIIAKRLKTHPLVKDIFYPELHENTEPFTKFLTTTSPGQENEPRFGPLLSIVLHGDLPVAQSFYDTVTIAKGPSLGTNFTICCPYSLLAHYYELDFIESCGVDRNLIRISVGLEDVEEIWQDLENALQVASKVYTPAVESVAR